jgi:hypothetical protein
MGSLPESRFTAYKRDMRPLPTIQLSEFCALFGFANREARYVLERGHVPNGVEQSPNTGHHRQFGPGHSFWLAIVLKLKQAGVKTPVAADVADYTNRALHAVTQNLVWDMPFLPAEGYFDTKNQYFVDVGDSQFMRLVTDSCPSQEGLYEFDWLTIKGKPTKIMTIKPFVIVRVDLSRIAKVLAHIQGWSCQCGL